MRGTVAGDDGLQHRVSRVWVSDDAGTLHEVVRSWVGDSQGVPKLWFDKNVVLDLIVTPTVLDATRVKLDWVLGPQGERADEYQVYRDGVLVHITTLTTFTDTGLSPGTQYTWRVDAILNDAFVVSGTAQATTDTFIPPAVIDLTAAPGGYDRVNLTWTVSGQDSFTIKRGGTVLATTGTSFTDTGLTPGTAYSYVATAVKAGATNATDTASATTTAIPAFGMSATATAYNNIATSWTNLGGGWVYTLVGNGSTILNGTTSTSYNHGVGESQGWNYTTYAYYNGTHYRTATASASTPARPVSYGTAYSNVGWENFTGWTGSTQRVLGGPNIYVGVGGWFTNMHALVYSHGDVNFRGEPRINGVAGPQQVYRVGRSHTNWPFSLGFGAGTFTTAMVVGGSNWGAAEWSPWTGQRWDYYLQVNHLDYAYYASQERDAEIRAEPWFREELAERLLGRGDLYIETWSNEEGTATVKAKVTDRSTGEVLIEWEWGD